MHRGIITDYMDLLASSLSSAAFVADPEDTMDWSEMDRQLLRVPDVVDESAEDPVEGFGALSDEQAYAVASIAARSIHARLHHSANRSAPDGTDPGAALSKVDACETAYNFLLERLREAALSADLAAARERYLELLNDIAEFEQAVRGIRLMDTDQRRTGNLGLRSADVARRFTMLAAGSIQVMRRLSTGTGASGMRRIAGNRTILRRHDAAQWLGTVPLSNLEAGENQVVMGEVAETGWVDRPDIPYSFLRLTDGAELRIHRRDIKQNGVTSGSLAWIRGKVEITDDDRKILVAHFEGPGSHSSEVWEDWLAEEVRDAYDLYPRVIDANWEFPQNNVRYAAGDLLSRVWSENNA